MSQTDKQRKRLISLLEELFQLDQPDLDFGFYKIMHAKAQTVSSFIQDDLLQIIQQSFGAADKEKTEQARLRYEQAIEQAKSYGASNPEETTPVKQAKTALETANNSDVNEGEIYDHLYRFFERYYDSGDFMSRRYFARETSDQAATYSVPYDGREVYLHWANRDQYYIKTAEYLTNFTFDIAKHFTTKEDRVLFNMPESFKLHCRIFEASEGEHNNNKTTAKTERFFLIAATPAVLEEGELVLQFEYCPDHEKSGTATKWQEKRLDEAERAIFTALAGMNEAVVYNQALSVEIGKDKTKRTVLRKYLNQYTKRNTTDYFIHKNLGDFLRRELDFYIKNEIMRLDDIESADAPNVETYLDKIKVLRTIARQLITFLAQLEEFQKKLWLKKKFVTDTQYCITLDRVPEQFYSEIAQNEQQNKEWRTLFAIDELDGYQQTLNVDFLKRNPFLVLDTAFFSSHFRDALLATLPDLDQTTDGLLIHSENFQALGLMQEKYQEQVQCIYIDPPYNAKSSEILYKNSYKHSSWLSLINDRLISARSLQTNNAVLVVAIDEIEQEFLGQVLSQNYPEYEKSCIAVTHNPSGQQGDNFSFAHEYAYFIHPKPGRYIGEQTRENENDWDIRNFRDVTGDDSLRKSGLNCFYPIIVKDGNLISFGEICPPDYHPQMNEKLEDGSIAIYPIDPEQIERKWRFARNTVEAIKDELVVHFLRNRNVFDIKRLKKKFNFKSIWTDARYSANNHGTQLLNKIIPKAPASYPKSLYTVIDCIVAGINENKNAVILDYFAGSGTTGHAVVNLNRADGGQRKYIMVEMGHYFDTVTKPRMQKVIYSKDWKEGKPVSREGSSHCFKTIRLESYEDTLNNLSFKNDDDREHALRDHADFRRDYMLQYWLDFETKGSPSLLNIEQFHDPAAYKLNLKKPGSDAYEQKTIDLVETFNWLIGLHVTHLDRWRGYTGKFKRELDPELPKENDTRLILDGKIAEADDGCWRLRKVAGRICRNPGDMDNTDQVLVIWRKLTDNMEEDNLMLDEWFKQYRAATETSALDVIYVNGSNNLASLQQDNEHWTVRLTEQTFHQKMWDV